MAQKKLRDLVHEVQRVSKRYPSLLADNAFVLWFLNAALLDDEKTASQFVVGGPSDGGVDAIYVNSDTRRVYIVQGKYHTGDGTTAQSRDAVALAELGKSILGPLAPFEARLARINPTVRQRLVDARAALREKKFGLTLLFATSARVARDLEETCNDIGEGEFRFQVHGRTDLLRTLADYEDGVAPPIGPVTIGIEAEPLKRSEPTRGITSWIFPLSGREVARLVNENGARLFARNIRGNLGAANEVNRSIRHTLDHSPEDFWYFNNGLTIVCDDAKREDDGRQLSMKVVSPQVINGQQTAYALSRHGRTSATVLTRVIAIPRGTDHSGSYDSMISSIVQATNWQSQILASDLISNDAQQIRLERALRDRDYVYIRKRQAKAEARRHLRFAPHALITKQEMAQALGACLLDPLQVRLGKEHLFSPENYSALFSTRPINEYLTMFWLGRASRERGRQTRTRPYAKWVVMNQAHREMRELLGTTSGRERFIAACESWRWDSSVLKPLMNALDCLYKAADKFYRRNRVIDGDEYDHSLFYKRKGVHEEFRRFWDTGSHPYRRKLNHALRRLDQKLLEFEEQQSSSS